MWRGEGGWKGASHSTICNMIAKKSGSDAKREMWTWQSVSYRENKMRKLTKKSREFNDRTECSFPSVFCTFAKTKKQNVLSLEVDLFASRTNFQIKPSVSWGRDPEATETDAFTVEWRRWTINVCISTFSWTQRTLRKTEDDQAEGLLIFPQNNTRGRMHIVILYWSCIWAVFSSMFLFNCWCLIVKCIECFMNWRAQRQIYLQVDNKAVLYWPTAPWFPQMLCFLTQRPSFLQEEIALCSYATQMWYIYSTKKTLPVVVSGKLWKNGDFL